MSTAPAPAPQPARPTEIKIYSHSNLFYWWPVWLLGLVLGGLTMFSKEYMVIVPDDAEVSRKLSIYTGAGKQPDFREGILFKEAPNNKENLRKHLPPNREVTDLEKEAKLTLHGTSRRGYGVIFVTVLLVVIFIT